MTRTSSSHRVIQPLLVCALALAPVGVACAWQAAAQPVPRPLENAVPPDTQFQQAARQQQVRDQLQKSQLQQQLHKSVSDNAKRPNANNPQMLRQQNQAAQAQHDRDRAAQQVVVDRYRDRAASLPRVIPSDAPASSRSGG